MNIGQKISHYIVESKLGDGGFGEVYLGRDGVSGMEVAMKCLQAGDRSPQSDKVQRFKREIACIAKLRHPGIVQLFDYGEEPDGTMYFIMEYVNGQSLKDLIRSRAPFSFTWASDIVLQILDALSEAHRQGIVHRDLNPGNIMVVNQGLRKDIVKILDFGIAKAFGGDGLDLTAQNAKNVMGFGTPQYMPPEQFYGKQLGPHSDLYAVGLVFYELLTGKPCFTGRTISEVIEKQIRVDPVIPPPFDAGPLGDVFKRALAKQISNRYATAADMYADIDAITRYQSPYLSSYASSSRRTPSQAPVKALAPTSGFEFSEDAATCDSRAIGAKPWSKASTTQADMASHETDGVVARGDVVQVSNGDIIDAVFEAEATQLSMDAVKLPNVPYLEPTQCIAESRVRPEVTQFMPECAVSNAPYDENHVEHTVYFRDEDDEATQYRGNWRNRRGNFSARACPVSCEMDIKTSMITLPEKFATSSIDHESSFRAEVDISSAQTSMYQVMGDEWDESTQNLGVIDGDPSRGRDQTSEGSWRDRLGQATDRLYGDHFVVLTLIVCTLVVLIAVIVIVVLI